MAWAVEQVCDGGAVEGSGGLRRGAAQAIAAPACCGLPQAVADSDCDRLMGDSEAGALHRQFPGLLDAKRTSSPPQQSATRAAPAGPARARRHVLRPSQFISSWPSSRPHLRMPVPVSLRAPPRLFIYCDERVLFQVVRLPVASGLQLESYHPDLRSAPPG